MGDPGTEHSVVPTPPVFRKAISADCGIHSEDQAWSIRPASANKNVEDLRELDSAFFIPEQFFVIRGYFAAAFRKLEPQVPHHLVVVDPRRHPLKLQQGNTLPTGRRAPPLAPD